MKRVFVLVLLVSGLVSAGMVSANMTKTGTTKDERLWSAPNVRASIIYRAGNTVSIYSPDANIALCKGENIPIYRSPALYSGKKTGERMPTYINSMNTDPDLANKQLVGEVKIFKHFGDHYAFGKLVVGGANEGDVAAKPSKSCLAS